MNKTINYFLLISVLIGININISSTFFDIGFSLNEELIWKCNYCDSAEMDEIFGFGWDDVGLFENLTQGKMMKWKISSIENNGTHFTTEVSVWVWRNDAAWGIQDIEMNFSHFINPNDYSEGLDYTSQLPFVPFWFPIPLNDYFNDLSFTSYYDIDNRVLPTINIYLDEGVLGFDYPQKQVSIIAIYNNKGLLSSYKLYTPDYNVVLDYSLLEFPYLALFSTLGLVFTFFFSISAFLIKRRKGE